MKNTTSLVNTANLSYYDHLHKNLGVTRSEYRLLKYIYQTSRLTTFSKAKIITIETHLGFNHKSKRIHQVIKSCIQKKLLEKNTMGMRLLFKWNEKKEEFKGGNYSSVIPVIKKKYGLTDLQYAAVKLFESQIRRERLTFSTNDGKLINYTPLKIASFAKKLHIERKNVWALLIRLKNKNYIRIYEAKNNTGKKVYAVQVLINLMEDEKTLIPLKKPKTASDVVRLMESGPDRSGGGYTFEYIQKEMIRQEIDKGQTPDEAVRLSGAVSTQEEYDYWLPIATAYFKHRNSQI